MTRARRAAEVEGTPTLAIADADREAVADAIAEILIELLKRTDSESHRRHDVQS